MPHKARTPARGSVDSSAQKSNSKGISALALTPREYRARLAQARGRFNRILKEEQRNLKKTVPADVKKRWVVGRDIGTLRGTWMRVRDIPTQIPFANDIIALQDRRMGRSTDGPRYFRTEQELASHMMPRGEAHALPVFDAEGKHLATVVHIGPDASQAQIRKLARNLIQDPTGRNVPSF